MPVLHFGEDPTAEPGTILMWAGSLSEIPSGWLLCDGNNGTPNLIGRFLRGVNGSDPGTTGGQDSFSLSSSHLPNHSHDGDVNNSGNHDHDVHYDTDDDIAYDYNKFSRHPSYGSYRHATSTSNGSHSHNIDNTTSTGSSSSIENRPAYYELAFIMKA